MTLPFAFLPLYYTTAHVDPSSFPTVSQTMGPPNLKMSTLMDRRSSLWVQGRSPSLPAETLSTTNAGDGDIAHVPCR